MNNIDVLRFASRWILLAALCAPMSAIWAAPDATHPDFVVTIEKGDTLIGLGQRWLADPENWPELQRHNKIRNPRLLIPGSTIAIPAALLRNQLTDVTIRSVSGQARTADGTPLAAGDRLREGAEIKTAEDGYVTIELVDGSTLQLQSRSRLKVERARRQSGSKATETRFQLPAGQAEVKFNPNAEKASKFEIRTGYASAAVRGTVFRVGAGEKATRTEVTKGTIAFAGLPPDAGTETPSDAVPIPEGFGSIVDESRKPIPPVRLLAAPALPREPVFQQAPSLRLGFPPLEGAVSYRARLAADENFERVFGEGVFKQPEVSFSGLAQGSYVLKVRGIDKFGLEGRDSIAIVGILPDKPPVLRAPSPYSTSPTPGNR